MKFLTAVQVLFIHNRLIDRTGGLHGIRDLGLLQSAVNRPRATFGKEELYPFIFEKTAALMESLVKNHAFLDGNKRTAVTSAGIFLQMNGFFLEASQDELERFAVEMATGAMSFEDAVAWFGKYVQKS